MSRKVLIWKNIRIYPEKDIDLKWWDIDLKKWHPDKNARVVIIQPSPYGWFEKHYLGKP